MKQTSLLIIFLIGACSTVSNERSSLEGVWTWEDIELTTPELVLKKHVLILKEESFEEAFFTNTESRGIQEGELLVSRDGDIVEFSTTGNIQTIYKGYLSENLLIIHSINNNNLNPPALYKRS
ncbi:MAG: hypothetical protein ACRC0X_01375 [Brevinema sp.]